VPVGAIIAIPAIRLSGVFLALATLGFGILLEQMIYTQDFMFGPTAEGIKTARPSFDLGPLHAGTDTGIYFVILAVVAIVAVGVAVLSETRLGKLLRAMGDSPRARDRRTQRQCHPGHRLLHLGVHRRDLRRAHRQPLHVRDREQLPVVQLAHARRARGRDRLR
jgi:hypothetical protein